LPGRRETLTAADDVRCRKFTRDLLRIDSPQTDRIQLGVPASDAGRWKEPVSVL